VSGDVLLVTPPSRTHYSVPPIGLGYVAAALRRRGFRPRIIDCVNERIRTPELASRIAAARPRAVGVQVFSYDMPATRSFLGALRRRGVDCPVVVGGAHPSGDPRGVLEDLPEADYGIQGEGEESFPELLERLEDGGRGDWRAVPGLIRREGGGVVVNPPSRIRELDRHAPPAWDLMDPRRYRSAPQGVFYRALPIAPISTSRGCPFPCTFCAGFSLMGRSVRLRSLDSVLEEIDHLRAAYGVRELHIVDDTFTQYPERVRELCRRLIAAGHELAIAFPNGVRLDTLDRETLELLRRAGCYSMILGIESGSQRVLDHMRKGTDLALIREKVGLIQEQGIEVMGFFIIGYPIETRADIRRTMRLACELPLVGAHFGNFLPLPGTEMTRRLQESGALGRIEWGELFYSRPICPPPGMTARELKRLQREAYLRFYLRPRMMLVTARRVRSLAHLRRLLERFWDYAFGR
jgi:radical SAM superfamily enzyme YgiQ (UPF0313 family)